MSRPFLVLACAAVLGCTEELPTDGPAFSVGDHGPSKPLIHAGEGTLNGVSLIRVAPLGWAPTGWAFCLIYYPPGPVVDNLFSTPLPQAVEADEILGCDRLTPSGPAVLRFDASNSPKWDAFVERLTNGVSEAVLLRGFPVNDDLILYNTGGGAWVETEGHTKFASKKNDGPDLQGYEIHAVELVVLSSSFSISPAPPDPLYPNQFYLNFQYDVEWKVYGKR